MNTDSTAPVQSPADATISALLRHFADLRDGRHGDAAVSRPDKEALFDSAVRLLAPHARRVLGEFNRGLLRETGHIEETGLRRTADSGLSAGWLLTWPEQRASSIQPITLHAHYGRGFHHPHLRGATVGEWPLNVFDEDQARAEVPTLRAIVAADLHNLVFQRDFRIVPAITNGRKPHEPGTVGFGPVTGARRRDGRRCAGRDPRPGPVPGPARFHPLLAWAGPPGRPQAFLRTAVSRVRTSRDPRQFNGWLGHEFAASPGRGSNRRYRLRRCRPAEESRRDLTVHRMCRYCLGNAMRVCVPILPG